jgi:hypothetical protein
VFTLTYADLEYETSISIWEFEMMIVVLPSFQLPTRLISQITKETVFINEHWHINLYMNIGISNWHNWIFDPRICSFLIYFSSLHDYWPPITWNSLVHTSWGEMERVWKTCFSAPQNAKKENEQKNKNQARYRLYIDS